MAALDPCAGRIYIEAPGPDLQRAASEFPDLGITQRSHSFEFGSLRCLWAVKRGACRCVKLAKMRFLSRFGLCRRMEVEMVFENSNRARRRVRSFRRRGFGILGAGD